MCMLERNLRMSNEDKHMAVRSIAVPNTVKQEEGEGDGDSGDGEPKRDEDDEKEESFIFLVNQMTYGD